MKLVVNLDQSELVNFTGNCTKYRLYIFMLLTLLVYFIYFWNSTLNLHDNTPIIDSTIKSSISNRLCNLKRINSPLYYINQNGWPYITKSEEVELLEFAKRKRPDIKSIKGQELNAINLLFLLPRIRGIVDTLKYDSLIRNKKEDIDWHIKYVSTYYDAVIVGTIIDIDTEEARKRCLYFKTTYFIKVDKVLVQHSDINVNDTIELKDINGYVGNCDSANKNLLSLFPGKKDYKVGERNIFLLSHNEYYSQFIKNQHNRSVVYDDKYCSNVFILSQENEYFDISISNVLEKFLIYSKK